MKQDRSSIPASRLRAATSIAATALALGILVPASLFLAGCVAGNAAGNAAGTTAASSTSATPSASDGTSAGAPAGTALSYDPKAKPLADPAALQKALAAGEAVIVVDVRTPEEYGAGHVKGAVNIPYDIIASKLPAADKAARIVLYCRSGRRSGIAAATLLGLGFSDVADMGPFAAWKGETAAGF